MPTPTQYWLTAAQYLEEKKAVTVSFSQLDLRRTMRSPFFPYFFVGKDFASRQLLCELLSSYGECKFRLEEEERSFKITAATFSDLNRLANLLSVSIGFAPLILPPERLFLLERGWSYFDCFTFTDGCAPVKTACASIPFVTVPFFSEPLHTTVSQLGLSDEQQAAKICEEIALSNALAMPFGAVPPTKGLQVELLFENLFFSLGFNRQKKSEKLVPPQKTGALPVEGFTELDFEVLWPTLLTKPFFNLGFDSIDCSCCKPPNINAGNVLPNSTVVVKILREAFYFQSFSSSFAQSFHDSNPATRENRLKRMGDFCLPEPPIGPFFKGQLVEVPLMDAVRLKRAGQAEIVSHGELHWFCTQKESALSRQIFVLHSKAKEAEKSLEFLSSRAFLEHGVLGQSFLRERPDYFFQKGVLSVCTNLLGAIVPQLLSPKSAFYTKQFAESVAAVKASVLGSLQSVAERVNGRVLQGRQGVFVRADKPLTLISEFSDSLKVPSVIQVKMRRKAFPA